MLDGFNEKYPNVTVKYNPAGDNTADRARAPRSRAATRPTSRRSPSRAWSSEFQAKGALEADSTSPRPTIEANFPPDFVKLGTIDGKLYGFVFKARQQVDGLVQRPARSRTPASSRRRPGTSSSRTRRRSRPRARRPTRSAAPTAGRSPTCSRTSTCARPARRSTTSWPTHEIKWTDPSVKTALTTMAADLRRHRRTSPAARPARCRPTSRPRSTNVFSDQPEGRDGDRGRLRPRRRRRARRSSSRRRATTSSRSRRSATPTNAVVGGGDSIVHVQGHAGRRGRSSSTWRRPRRRRSGPSAAASRSPNKNSTASAYPDEITRTTATAIAEADTFRFDMSDLAPAAFGGTPGQGEWKILQDFLAQPERRRRRPRASSRRRPRRRTSRRDGAASVSGRQPAGRRRPGASRGAAR